MVAIIGARFFKPVPLPSAVVVGDRAFKASKPNLLLAREFIAELTPASITPDKADRLHVTPFLEPAAQAVMNEFASARQFVTRSALYYEGVLALQGPEATRALIGGDGLHPSLLETRVAQAAGGQNASTVLRDAAKKMPIEYADALKAVATAWSRRGSDARYKAARNLPSEILPKPAKKLTKKELAEVAARETAAQQQAAQAEKEAAATAAYEASQARLREDGFTSPRGHFSNFDRNAVSGPPLFKK